MMTKLIPWPEFMKQVNFERNYHEEQRFYGKLRNDMRKRLRIQRWQLKHLNILKP